MPMTGMLLISTPIRNSFWTMQLFRKWDKGMDINPEDETSYTTHYQQAFLKYVENEYSAKHPHMPVNKLQSLPSSNPILSATASGYCRSSFDLYDVSNGEEY
jgi:hypothetical protein